MPLADAPFPIGFITPIHEALDRVLNLTAPPQSDGSPAFRVEDRPLSGTDHSRTVGIYPVNLSSDAEKKEIGPRGREPYETNYVLRIENMFISADPIQGRRDFGVDSKAIRSILYRDPTFELSFLGLREEFMGETETVIKYDISKQEYVVGPANTGFRYVAITELLITTNRS